MLGFLYPYNQAIGFYLAKASYQQTAETIAKKFNGIQLLRRLW